MSEPGATKKRFKRRFLALALIIIPGAAAGFFLAFKHPQRSDMVKLVPASALGFVEVDSLSDALSGLTSTRAWKELAPAFGVSGQLRDLGFATDVIGRTGLGPEEAVVAARAQYAIVITEVEADTGSNEDGPYIHFKPHLVLEAESHSKPDVASRLVRDRAVILANRIYGMDVKSETENYSGDSIFVFHGPGEGHQLVAASHSSVIFIGNDIGSVKSCLDVVAGRSPSLADDVILKQYRSEVDQGAPVFAYLTAAGVTKFSQLAPAVFATRFTTDPEVIESAGSLFGHLSSQAISGLLYSSDFQSGEVVDRYLTVLTPGVATGLEEFIRPAKTGDDELTKLIPQNVESFSLMKVQDVGDLPERGLKALGPKLDVVGALALREFVVMIRRRLGLSSGESLEPVVGDQLAVLKFNETDPIAMCISIRDKAKAFPYVAAYLSYGGSTVSNGQYKGVQIAVSSYKDARAASFIGNYVILGTRAQIVAILDSEAAKTTVDDSQGLGAALRDHRDSTIVSCRTSADDAAEMMLAVSKLTRTTDGSQDLLQQDAVRKAEAKLVPSVSFTEFRDAGVYTETHSAVGNFSFIDVFNPSQ